MGIIILLIDTKFGPFCVALLSSQGIVDLPPNCCFHKFLFLPAFAFKSSKLANIWRGVGKILSGKLAGVRPVVAVSTFDEPASSSLSGGQWPSQQQGGRRGNQNILCPPLRGGTSQRAGISK